MQFHEAQKYSSERKAAPSLSQRRHQVDMIAHRETLTLEVRHDVTAELSRDT